MDLKDALVPFLPSGMPFRQDFVDALSRTRVAFLSKHLNLKVAMERSLPTNRYALTQVCSTELIEKAIEKRVCDVAIVDIDRPDEWPISILSRFDGAATDFPIILLCRKRHEVLNYHFKAQHVTAIVPYESIGDPRFLALIEAAVFRAEIIRNADIEDNWDCAPRKQLSDP